MHAGDRLHHAAVAQPEAAAIDGLHLPMCERPYSAMGMSSSREIAPGMLVAHSSSLPRWR